MRLFSILLLLLVVSCASPQKNPDSFYAGKYAPAKFNVEKNAFVASASVVSKDDVLIAEKAAYLKLMKDGQRRGYKYFKITNAGKTTFIGTRYTLKGKLYRSDNGGSGVYKLSAISRVLQGLPIKEPYVAPKPRKKPIRKAAVTQIEAAKPRARPVPTPAPSNPLPPILEPVQETGTDDGGPTVIMAPEDITGSISRPSRINNPVIAESFNTQARALDHSTAVSEIPSGVLIRRSGSSLY